MDFFYVNNHTKQFEMKFFLSVIGKDVMFQFDSNNPSKIVRYILCSFEMPKGKTFSSELLSADTSRTSKSNKNVRIIVAFQLVAE